MEIVFWKIISNLKWQVERIISKGKVIYLWLKFKKQIENIDLSKLIKQKDYTSISTDCYFCKKFTVATKTLNGYDICADCLNKIQKILNG